MVGRDWRSRKVSVADVLFGRNELAVRAGTEASIIKPAGLRQWLGVRGLEEAQTT